MGFGVERRAWWWESTQVDHHFARLSSYQSVDTFMLETTLFANLGFGIECETYRQ